MVNGTNLFIESFVSNIMEKMDTELKSLNLEDFMKFVQLINYYRDKVPKQETMQVGEEVEWPLLSTFNLVPVDMPLSGFASLFVKGREICTKAIGPSMLHVIKILAELHEPGQDSFVPNKGSSLIPN